MEKLTSRQAQILKMIRRFMESKGFPPTRAEIAAKLGFRSPNAAEDHLRALERKGAIRLLPGASRGIQVLTEGPAGIPVVSRVAAGVPLVAEENIESHYAIDPNIFDPAADFFLRVRGLSMRDAGIQNGDLLAVHATPDAASGQIVVARLGEEITVKRFRRRGNQVRLLPENPEFTPVEVDMRENSLVIEGIVVGVLRTHLGSMGRA